MTRFGTDYHIARSTGQCWATGQPMTPGSPCIAAIVERPGEEGFDRLDVSMEAWDSGARPEGLFSFWKAIVPSPDAKPKLLVDDAVLMDVFERMAADDRPQRQAFRFVLALILMRKKLLKFVGRKGEGEGERWLLVPRGPAGEIERTPIEVVNPQLSDDDVRTLTDQLGEILQGEL